MIHIYFRHTPTNRSTGKLRPSWFTHETCFLNLLEGVREQIIQGNIRLNIVFDGSPTELENDFTTKHLEVERKHFPRSSVSVYRIDGGDQRKAWRACVSQVRSDATSIIRNEDIIYFLENDYLHMPGWADEVNDLSKEGISWDYLTLYDHPDKYPNFCEHHDSSRYVRLRSKLYATSHRHWRTIPNTCATYMVRRHTFLRDQRILSLGIYDFRLFRILTKLKRRMLISPIPALATHSMTGLLSPTIDWARDKGDH